MYSEEQRSSEDIRNNKLYSKILKEHLETYQHNLEVNPPDNHIGFVKAQSAIAALRLLNEQLMYPSEIQDNN